MRMLAWFFISAALMGADTALYTFTDSLTPSPLHIAVHKADLLSLGAWFGYWIDRAIAPYARPHRALASGELSLAACMLRRAFIVSSAMIVMGLGL